MNTIIATESQLATAFTEWERRYREDPEGFQSESEKLAESPETYGEACAPYFIEILNGAKPGDGWEGTHLQRD